MLESRQPQWPRVKLEPKESDEDIHGWWLPGKGRMRRDVHAGGGLVWGVEQTWEVVHMGLGEWEWCGSGCWNLSKCQSSSVVRRMPVQGRNVQSEECSTSDWEGVCLCEQPSIECWTQASVDGLYIEGAFRMGSWGWKDCPYKGVVPSGVSEHGQDEKGPFPVGYPSLGVGASSEWRECTEIVAVGVAWHRTSEPEKSEESFCSVDSTGAVLWDWL